MIILKNIIIKNKDRILERLSLNQWIRYKEDIEFKLLKRIQARITNLFPDYDGTLKQLLGCSSFFLLKWLNLKQLTILIGKTYTSIILDQYVHIQIIILTLFTGQIYLQSINILIDQSNTQENNMKKNIN